MDEAGQRVWTSASYLAEHLHQVPVLLVPCQWTRPPEMVSQQAGYWGSILPAVWSFMLAARSRGLGSAWTTMHLAYEEEAADLLGIPFARCAQAGLIPVAYTKAPISGPQSAVARGYCPLGDVVTENRQGASQSQVAVDCAVGHVIRGSRPLI